MVTVANRLGALELEIGNKRAEKMSLVERSPSEQESLSALTSRTESSLSGSTEPAGYEGLKCIYKSRNLNHISVAQDLYWTMTATYGPLVLKMCAPSGIAAIIKLHGIHLLYLLAFHRESIATAAGGKQGGIDVHLHRSYEGATLPVGSMDKQEILRQIHLRRHIDQLSEKKTQTENEVEQNKYVFISIIYEKK